MPIERQPVGELVWKELGAEKQLFFEPRGKGSFAHLSNAGRRSHCTLAAPTPSAARTLIVATGRPIRIGRWHIS